MKHKLTAAVVTHVGNIRDNNEDHYFLAGQRRQQQDQYTESAVFQGVDLMQVFAVADGMGGLAHGEIASEITIDCLRGCAFSQIRDIADRSIREANRKICAEAGKVQGRRMGSTLAALYMDRGKAISCNIGDSRVYLLRQGLLTQLSTDHSRERLMVSLGLAQTESARTDRKSHILTQNLGTPEDELYLMPAYSEPIKTRKHDRFLLCSDGLTDMLRNEEILHAAQIGAPLDAAQRLVELALEHGGRDNVTVMLIDVGSLCLI